MVATIGPLLAIEFGLSASGLGLLAACFFAAYAVAQLPIGLALDLLWRRAGCRRRWRWSRRRASCSARLAPDVLVLALGRIMCGHRHRGRADGDAEGEFAVVSEGTRGRRDRRGALPRRGMGGMAATVPVQSALPLLGWRGIFVLLAVLPVLSPRSGSGCRVPDRPPGAVGAAAAQPGARDRASSAASSAHRRLPALPAGDLRAVGAELHLPGALGRAVAARRRRAGGWAAGGGAAVLRARPDDGQPGDRAGGLLRCRRAASRRCSCPIVGIGGVLLAQAVLIAGAARHLVAVRRSGSCSPSAGRSAPAGYAAVGQRFPPELQGRVATAINFSDAGAGLRAADRRSARSSTSGRARADGGWDPAGYAWALSRDVPVAGAGRRRGSWCASARGGAA